MTPDEAGRPRAPVTIGGTPRKVLINVAYEEKMLYVSGANAK